MMLTQVMQPLPTSNEPETGLNPKKFVLWLMIIASVMLFAAFTSAYIVRRGEGNWRVFDLPNAFTINLFVAMLSSLFMQLAFRSAKRDELERVKLFTFLTLLTGIAFIAGQWIGWGQLVDSQVFLTGNPSESFLYVISATHFFHVLLGLGFVTAILIKSFQFKVHRKNMLSISMCTTFWHFIGAMWIYLYFFFLLNR